jgi:HlyD family secretion protein
MACARTICLIAATALALAGCGPKAAGRVQGYVEGEFVYVAAPFAGALDALHVERGAQVKAGDPLFALERVEEQAAREEAERRLAQARAALEDLRKGSRPSEIESVEAQLRQAEAALALSEKELERQEALFKADAASERALDQARSTHDQNRQRVAQIQADLKTARLGSRGDQVRAAEANVRALEAALERADWGLSEKSQAAPVGGVVFDTLYRQGEWVAAGRPVVVLLPPGNIKVHAFVPETRIAGVRLGDPVEVSVDGVAEPLAGKVSFISPRAEFTPPVIYSRESREKLVFMIEVAFPPEVAAGLHPGQPVDVQLNVQHNEQ